MHVWAALILAASAACAFADTVASPDKTQKIVAFGSSWSDLDFQQHLAQPSAESPFGNPAHFDNGHNQEGGPNYLRFLTSVYNNSVTLLYDFARSGATINNEIVDGAVPDLVHQVTQNFTPHYSSQKGVVWDSDDTIFNVWMIDNDILKGINHKKDDKLAEKLMDSYWDSVARLYEAGARKFLFVSSPSQERSPLVKGFAEKKRKEYMKLKRKLDNALYDRFKKFRAYHGKEVKAVYFDASKWLDPILDKPAEHGFNADALCSEPRKGCIWSNDFHIVPHAHDLMAQAMLPHYKELGF